MDAWIAAAVFLITYGLIASDRLDKTVLALLGGLTMVVLGVVDQETAFHAIDFNVIFLLAGMMILAGILRRTGFFQWIAIRAVKVAGGEPFRLLVVLSVIAAVLSAFLDNVTTVVLIAPVTLYIATVLRVSPLPFLISEILASNIGGTATLIGDPPNILIGSASGLDFTAFLVNMGPPAVLIFGAFLVAARFMFGGDIEVHAEVRDAVLELDEREVLSDRRLLTISLIVIGLTIVGFLVHGLLGYEPATIALVGATVLMLLTRLPPEEVLKEIEWTTLFFFIGLFMLVEGVREVGIIEGLADRLFEATSGDLTVTSLGLLWLSGISSGIIDNIPYTATMIPLVQQLGNAGIPIEPLWWSLALGACLGGNFTIIGASANVVVANLAARADHPISFRLFFKYGAVTALGSLVIASGWVWFRYLT